MIFKNIILFIVIILFSGIITSQFFLTENLNNQFMYSSEDKDKSLCSAISEYGVEQPMNMAPEDAFPTFMPFSNPPIDGSITQSPIDSSITQSPIDGSITQTQIDHALLFNYGQTQGPLYTPYQTAIEPTPYQTAIEPTPYQTAIEPTSSPNAIEPIKTTPPTKPLPTWNGKQIDENNNPFNFGNALSTIGKPTSSPNAIEPTSSPNAIEPTPYQTGN